MNQIRTRQTSFNGMERLQRGGVVDDPPDPYQDKMIWKIGKVHTIFSLSSSMEQRRS